MRVNFIVIGAGKSGTSWLQKVFERSDEIFVPSNKEVHYFNEEGLDAVSGQMGNNPNFGKGIGWYHEHFDFSAGKVVGEISPSYLWSNTAPRSIKQYNPDIKLIAILRDPSKRAISQYQYLIQRGYVSSDLSLKEACKKNSSILTRGLYGQYICRYLSDFPRSQILVLRFEDLVEKDGKALGRIAKFLGVSQLEYLHERTNVSGGPRYPRITIATRSVLDMFPMLSGFVKKALMQLNVFDAVKNMLYSGGNEKPVVTDEDVEWLKKYYSEDLTLLEKTLGWELSDWK